QPGAVVSLSSASSSSSLSSSWATRAAAMAAWPRRIVRSSSAVSRDDQSSSWAMATGGASGRLRGTGGTSLSAGRGAGAGGGGAGRERRAPAASDCSSATTSGKSSHLSFELIGSPSPKQPEEQRQEHKCGSRIEIITRRNRRALYRWHIGSGAILGFVTS